MKDKIAQVLYEEITRADRVEIKKIANKEIDNNFRKRVKKAIDDLSKDLKKEKGSLEKLIKNQEKDLRKAIADEIKSALSDVSVEDIAKDTIRDVIEKMMYDIYSRRNTTLGRYFK
jgi:flagellar hook-basal body complex protein FliE